MAALTPLGDSFAGRYSIDREIGRGGMATVYLARDVALDRLVAIKVVRPDLLDSRTASRFLREIRLTCTLQHPRIVPVLDAGTHNDQPFLVLPYMGGGTLRNRLDRERQLPIKDAIAIAKAVAEALEHAHQQRLIHRDVKPENILFTGGEPHLADFGVARALEGVIGQASSSEGIIRGTPAYMSPEQASGRHEYDGRSDVFSLGCVLFEMIAGVPPYVGATPESMIAQRMAAAPRDLQVYRPTVPAALNDAVIKALAVVPADRFRTAGEMADALDRIRVGGDGFGVRTGVSGAWQRPGVGVVATVGLLCVGVAIAVVAWQKRPAEAALDDSLVAIAPFDVYDPRLALWREGFMDILAGSLDGAGRIRTVAPSVVARQWSGSGDAASAAALARATGARYVVLGRVTDAGPDSIRGTASILDAQTKRERAIIDVRQHRERPDRLADSLSVRLIGEFGESVDRRTRLRSLGAANPLALKAFLRGEYFMRRTQWDSAAVAYGEAISLDSTFALANWRMKTATWSQAWGPDTVGDGFALAAGRLNHGLAPRESLLIAVDSLWASLPEGDPGAWTRMRRLASTLDEAARRYPGDPWVWYKIGEARWHLPIGLDYPLSQHLAAFDRAIALDSGFALAYVTHAVELGLVLHGPERALRYTKGFRMVALPGVEDSAARLTERLLDSTRARAPDTGRLLERASADVLYRVAANLDMWFDSSETATQVARRLARSSRGTGRFVDPATVQLRLARILGLRGHLREAWQEMRHSVSLDDPDGESIELFADLARFGVVPTAIADSVFASWIGRSQRGTIFALGWWTRYNNIVALDRAATAFESATDNPSDRQIAAYGNRAIRAYKSLLAGDTTQALAGFRLLADSLCADCYLDWLTRAELLRATGDRQAAKQQLERVLTYAWNVPTYPLASFHLGRLAEETGDRETAAKAYGVVSAAWRRADVVLQPYVRDAIAGRQRVR
jgi:serine/threonine-protein kinase